MLCFLQRQSFLLWHSNSAPAADMHHVGHYRVPFLEEHCVTTPSEQTFSSHLSPGQSWGGTELSGCICPDGQKFRTQDLFVQSHPAAAPSWGPSSQLSLQAGGEEGLMESGTKSPIKCPVNPRSCPGPLMEASGKRHNCSNVCLWCHLIHGGLGLAHHAGLQEGRTGAGRSCPVPTHAPSPISRASPLLRFRLLVLSYAIPTSSSPNSPNSQPAA